jgi:hypothetical protein
LRIRSSKLSFHRVPRSGWKANRVARFSLSSPDSGQSSSNDCRNGAAFDSIWARGPFDVVDVGAVGALAAIETAPRPDVPDRLIAEPLPLRNEPDRDLAVDGPILEIGARNDVSVLDVRVVHRGDHELRQAVIALPVVPRTPARRTPGST